MKDGFAVLGETTGTVRHHALALGRSDLRTKVSFVALTENAFLLLAFGGIARNHNIPSFD